MAAHQRRRHACASGTETLPTELLLEIVARSDATATFFRCAAACKVLRREIASPNFVRRICETPGGVMPSRMLGFLDKEFSLIHPATPAAASFAESHLAPFISRGADDLLKHCEAVTSRGGLVLLERLEIAWEQDSERTSDMCVYDPMTGTRTFFPLPPSLYQLDNQQDGSFFYKYVLLTEADGIGCSFLLLAVNLDGVGDLSSRCISVRTVSSDTAGCQWSAVSLAAKPGPPLASPLSDEDYHTAVVLDGVVHFLMPGYIITYDVGTTTTGMIQLPKDCNVDGLHLGSTRDGSLRLFGPIYGFTLSFWVMSGHSWSQRVDIETLDTLRSLLEPWKEEEDLMAEEEGGVPDNDQWEEDNDDDVEEFFLRYGDRVKVKSIGDQRTGVVLLRMENIHFLLDMDTTEISRIKNNRKLLGVPYMVDLSSRLSTMKMF